MVSIQTIEKEFGFTSKMTGIIVASNDASALIAVALVSYFGAKRNKPQWMGIGAIITGKYLEGSSCLVWITPLCL